MPSQPLIEEHIEPQNKIDKLVERIESNLGDKPAVIGSQSYAELNTQEVYAVSEAIEDNQNITAIRVEVGVPPRGAESIVNCFLNSKRATELQFDMMRRIDYPSQWRLMQFTEGLKESVDIHNSVQEQLEQEALLILASMSYRKNKRKLSEDTSQEKPGQPPTLPVDLLRYKIQPMFKSHKKRLVLS